MINQVKTFRLFVRPDDKSKSIASKIRELNAKKASPLIESDENADLVIAIGGDGTFIHAITETQFSKEIIYTGIHTGTLGFMQDLGENDILSLLRYIEFERELKTRKVYTALVKVHLQDGSVNQFFALNDIVISGENYSKFSFAEYINGELLQNVTGSAILIATSTGDTAFSANIGGAIDFSNNFQLACKLFAPIRNSTTERIIENPIICSRIELSIIPTTNLTIIIDGKRKDILSEHIKNIEVSMVDDSNYINKLDIMNDFSKVRVVREKILGYQLF